MDQNILKYIEKRYQRWFDYAEYHCSLAGIEGESLDVLNEVIAYVLEKDENKLLALFNTQKGQYRQLDFYVLRMIKLNIYSPTSPYQNKYKPIPAAVDVQFSRLKVEDIDDDQDDIPARILDQYNQVRNTFENLNLSEKAKRIFEHRFFQGQPFSEWTGTESKKELYETYNKVVKLIKQKLNGKTLI